MTAGSVRQVSAAQWLHTTALLVRERGMVSRRQG